MDKIKELEDAIDELKSLSGYCPDHFDESPNCQQECAMFVRERITIMLDVLEAHLTALKAENVDRVTTDEFWPINSTNDGDEPITRPRIDWWWLCKKIEFQRRELRKLNNWLKFYRDRKKDTPKMED